MMCLGGFALHITISFVFRAKARCKCECVYLFVWFGIIIICVLCAVSDFYFTQHVMEMKKKL